MSNERHLVVDSTVPEGVDDAEGVEKRNWYVAVVNHNSEKLYAEKLAKLGYDSYVASQEEYRVWRNGKRKKIDRVVIPSMIFVRCSEKERQSIVRLPFIFRFLTNRAGELNQFGKPVAIIPDNQIAMLKFMLGNSTAPVEFVDRVYSSGDKVRVARGGLRGLVGVVICSNADEAKLYVEFPIFGYAKVSISTCDLELLK